MGISKSINASELTMQQLFADRLTDTVCINLHHGREVWVATLMCAEYLESVVDSIIVRDDDFKPIGIFGGFELLDCLRKNPTRDYKYNNKIGKIMHKNITQIDKVTRLADLIEIWKNSGRAFSIILNEYGDCSTVSARRMIEVGARCKTDTLVSSVRKSKVITFEIDATLGEVLDLMFNNRVRKLLLANSHQFISDRLILSEISKILRFQPDVDYFLDLPIKQFKMADAIEVTGDLKFNEVCSMMQTMDHAMVVYGDTVLTAWDVCLGLLSEGVSMSVEE